MATKPRRAAETLILTDDDRRLRAWPGAVMPFEAADDATLASWPTIILAPENVAFLDDCRAILDRKRAGLLDRVDLILGSYKGRHIWTPENDALVAHWVVHARSEREVFDSDRLVFVPLCLDRTADSGDAIGDDGHLFLGGRKWRELGIGIAAMIDSGLPGRIISDFAPSIALPGRITLVRDRVPREVYFRAMRRSRVVLLPLKGTPVSHGQTDAVSAVLLGKPLIVTAGASCDDYVRHGETGLLVEDNSAAGWLAAIVQADAQADRLAAGARALASAFAADRRVDYLIEVVETPERRLIDRRFAVPAGSPDRSEWLRAGSARTARIESVAQGVAITAANAALREGRLADAAAAAETCLDGKHRMAALRVLMRVSRTTDPARLLAVTATLLAEGGGDAEVLADRADALRQHGDAGGALEAAQAAVTLAPGSARARRALAMIQRAAGQR